MAKKKGKKKAAKRKQTIDLTLRLNVELAQQKQAPKGVKRIQSRRRPNLREMRKGMMTQAQAQGGGGGAQQSVFANPAFYGNVKMLSNSAMNQFQNQRYSLEQQVRESSAEQKAMLAAGRAEAAQQAAQTMATQVQQLSALQQQFGFQSQQLAAVSAAAGVEKGKADTLQQQQDQQAIEQQYTAQSQADEEAERAARLAEVRQYSDARLKEEASKLKGFRDLDYSPQAFDVGSKFKDNRAAIVKVLAFGDPDETATLVGQFKGTKRATGKSQSREKQAQAARLQQKADAGTPKKAVRGYGSDDSSDEDADSDFEDAGDTILD